MVILDLHQKFRDIVILREKMGDIASKNGDDMVILF